MALGVGEHETQNGSVAIKTLATVVDQHHNVDDSNAIQQDQTSVQNGNSTAENNDKSNAIKSTKLVESNTSFLRAARAGELDRLIDFLERGEVADINACNANGLNALHLASKDGHIEIVSELLKRGAGVDNATKKGNSALHIASLAGQKEVIKILLQHGANVNLQSLSGFTPLYMAAQENHDGCVKYLLAKGANQTLATEDGFTPLAVALQQGHEKVVAVLLENDTRGKVRLPALHIAAKKDDVKAALLLLENEHNPDIASKSGFTPLHIAAHYGNTDIANLLIEKGADVNYTAKHNITPLHVACKWGKSLMVNLLIAKGARIDSTTRDGLTPLHCAARSGHEQVIDILLDNQAHILSKTKNGLAPLHMAAQGEHVEAARILLIHEAPVDEVTVDYLTALHVAAHCGHVKVAKLLLDRNADPNARALNGFTPLHIACKKNRQKMIELLLKHGASISATTESGLTPLHVASFMGCMNIVIYLLRHDASPDIPTVRGETPLHLAARANQTDIIRILLRNGAQVDAKAREEQTPLHVAARLGNVDIVMLLLQNGADVDSVTKDLYTPLHITAKEGQDEVAAVLLEHNATIDAATKKSFTPLHLAAKYGHIKVVQLLLQKGAPVDAQGKNSVTPLHVGCHYNNQNVALLLLEKGASPHSSAKNGHTPLHIVAKRNQMDIATTLLEYGALPDAESKSGFTPIHLAAQEGHSDMVVLLIEYKANADHAAKNGLTPLHLCAQEDKVRVAEMLLDHGAKVDPATKAGFTPLHVAAHYGQIQMVRLLLENDAKVESVTKDLYTPLHQAAQQGHTLVINLLLKHKADPNAVTSNGQTALNIANKLGYITVVETLKVVTETNIKSTSAVNADGVPQQPIEEKYKVIAPEAMHETFMSDSEDEGGEDPIMSDQQQYKYMTFDDIKGLDDNIKIDTNEDTKAEKGAVNEYITNLQTGVTRSAYPIKEIDNVNIVRQPIHAGFLVSFLVDARGGAMRGCRHSGVRVIVPPKSAAQPTRITCRYVKPQRIPNPPPLMEGEALVSRILELAPVAAKFLGPVILEVPHFASLREKEREIIILRSDNGDTWREHTLYDSEEAIQDVLNESFELNELNQLEDFHTNRIIRIVTHDFPHFFAIVSRIRQEVHAIGSDGGTVSSLAVPQVQAIFPPNALTKKIRVGLQAQPCDSNLTAKLLGRSVAVSPVVTVEPRRRKFHKGITLSMPAPRAHTQGMINQYSGNAPTLRLLCSITGGQNRAVWEDVTGSTPLTFVKDCVSFTTTVSARFWLMDCRNIGEACKMATELYSYMAYVPFMVKFVVFAKRTDVNEAKLSVFCMTDDREDKTLEHQEHFTEVAKSRDLEVLEGRTIYLEFAGSLIPILKSGEQLAMSFHAFKENRLAFTVRVKDDEASIGRINFMSEPKVAKGEATQTPLCTLNIALPDKVISSDNDDHSLDYTNRYSAISTNSTDAQNLRVLLNGSGFYTPADEIHKADIRLSDICNLLGSDWEKLAKELDVPETDIDLIKSEYVDKPSHQAMVMLRLWLRQSGKQATGNNLEQALHRIKRSDIVDKCIFNLELVTDEMERTLAKMQLDQSGFDSLKEEIGPSRDTSLNRNAKLDISYINESNVTVENDGTASPAEEDLNSLRKESISMGISQHRAEGNLTPPPSPAEFSSDRVTSPGERFVTNDTAVAPTAEHESSDVSLIPNQSIVETTVTTVTTSPPKVSAQQSVEKQSNSNEETGRRFSQQQKDEIHEQIKENITDIVNKAAEEVLLKQSPDHDVEEVLNELERDLEQKCKIPTSIKVNADVHESHGHDLESDENDSSRSVSPTLADESKGESRIPLPSGKTSTPIKVRTIKKHSKVNRELTSKPGSTIRPAVEDIEWDVVNTNLPAEDHVTTKTTTTTTTKITKSKIPKSKLKTVQDDGQTKVISSVDLDNVIKPVSSDDDDEEPGHLIITGEVGDGEHALLYGGDDDNIDEVILVQTPGSDYTPDSEEFSNKGSRIETQTIRKTIGDDGATTEEITIITEEHYPSGEIVVTQQQQQHQQSKSSSGPTIMEDTSRDTNTNTNMSLSINSESDSDSRGGSPYQVVRPSTESGATRSTTGKTLGSSSGSDVALHEGGAELSDDEPGAKEKADVAGKNKNKNQSDFYQNNDQPSSYTTTTETVDEFRDPQDNSIRTVRQITKTTTTTSSEPIDEILAASLAKQYGSGDDAEYDLLTQSTYTSSFGPESLEQPSVSQASGEHPGRESMQTIVSQFVQEERKHP